jgi:hypothetical protein
MTMDPRRDGRDQRLVLWRERLEVVGCPDMGGVGRWAGYEQPRNAQARSRRLIFGSRRDVVIESKHVGRVVDGFEPGEPPVGVRLVGGAYLLACGHLAIHVVQAPPPIVQGSSALVSR